MFDLAMVMISNNIKEYTFTKKLLVIVASIKGIWYFDAILRLRYVAKHIKGQNFNGKKWIYGDKIMKRVTGRLLILTILLAFLSITAGCQTCCGLLETKQKTMLFNGKDLAGWKLFIPDETIDTSEAWSVKDGVVHCTGKPNGYMRTKSAYENYKLHLEWRWPGEPTNSGVLLHVGGEDKLWPKCIECQLKAENAGDIVLMNGAGIAIDCKDMQNPSTPFVIIPKKENSSEKTPGQWNTYEIFCNADVIRCYVNGVLQNEGTGATATSGRICLQSEGGPIEFRNIYIESLE
jgi:hypothetical protein